MFKGNKSYNIRPSRDNHRRPLLVSLLSIMLLSPPCWQFHRMNRIISPSRLVNLVAKLFTSCYTNWNSRKKRNPHPWPLDCFPLFFLFLFISATATNAGLLFTGQTNSIRDCGSLRIVQIPVHRTLSLRSFFLFCLTVQFRFYGRPRYPFSRPICQSQLGISIFCAARKLPPIFRRWRRGVIEKQIMSSRQLLLFCACVSLETKCPAV